MDLPRTIIFFFLKPQQIHNIIIASTSSRQMQQ